MPTPTASVKSLQNRSRELVQTSVNLDLLMLHVRSRADYVAQWQRWIDNTLRAWLRDPSQLADDGVSPPTDSIIRLAWDYAEQFRDAGWPPPNRIVCDPNGGIVFQIGDHDTTEAIHIWDDGTVEYLAFRGTRLVNRAPI